MRSRLLGLGAFALCGTLAAGAHADGGYFSGAKGAHGSGRGGAFTARADDVSAVTFNPAELTHIGTTIIQLGNRFSYNEHTYQRNPTLDWGNAGNGVPPYVEFAPVRNKTPWQVLDPFIGIASNFGLEDWGFALAAFSPAGTAREVYPNDGGQRYMMVRRNAQIIDYDLSVAWKHNDVFGVGASLQWLAVPTLEYGLIIDGNPFKAQAHPVSDGFDINANVKGSDLFTLNAILGAWVRPNPNLELGVSGQILPSEIQTKSKLKTSFVQPSTAQDAQILLKRDGTPADDVTLSLPLPMTARVGARYRYLRGTRELFDVELDVVYETWTRVKRFRLDSNNMVAEYRGQKVPVGVIDVAKHWQDTLGLHLGGDYTLLRKRATLRGGLYYETPVAPEGYANIDFSDGPELGGALGASVFFGKVEVALTTEYRAQTTVHVSDTNARLYQATPGTTCHAPYTNPSTCNAHYLGLPAPPINGGTYNAYSMVASLEGTYRF
jgi:long-subunit fatty acid transport protein